MDDVSARGWIHEKRKRDELYQCLLDWRWEWFCSLNLPQGKSFMDAEQYLKHWRSLFYKKGLKIGYMGLFSMLPHCHIHLLMVGYSADKSSLFHVDKWEWEKEWSRLTKQTADIQWINDVDAVAGYISFKNTYPGLYELLKPHNKKVLKSCKREKET